MTGGMGFGVRAAFRVEDAAIRFEPTPSVRRAADLRREGRAAWLCSRRASGRLTTRVWIGSRRLG